MWKEQLRKHRSVSCAVWQINVANATTATVSETMAMLKILTTNTSAMTQADIIVATNILLDLSQTNPETVKVRFLSQWLDYILPETLFLGPVFRPLCRKETFGKRLQFCIA